MNESKLAQNIVDALKQLYQDNVLESYDEVDEVYCAALFEAYSKALSLLEGF